MSRDKPAFIITVDTEGDNLWAAPRDIGTRNAEYVERFQRLCEEHGFKPTWLTNYEMAMSDKFVVFGRDALRRGAAEIGMHLHAWNSPPIKPLTDDDYRWLPYLIEYPADVLEEKVAFMTELLAERFEVPMQSHRAGRWAFDAHYARTLVKYGYKVDCSVTPHVSWKETLGDPKGQGGTDYRNFPSVPYFMDLDDISQPGESTLLEVPTTVIPSPLYKYAPWAYSINGIRRFAWRYQPKLIWLYPDGTNLAHMLRSVRHAVATEAPYIEFIIHSSELMPGGSPQLPDASSIEVLYSDLGALFKEISRNFVGATLSEFRAQWIRRGSAVTMDTSLARV